MSLLTAEERRTFFMLPHEKQSELIAGMSPADLLALDVDFEMWAHEGQLPPSSEGWRVWLMLAGRGFGKTRAGAEWIYRLGMIRPVRIALVAATIDEARAIMVEGASGILSVARARGRKLSWEPSRGRLRWPGGSEAQLFSGDNADGLRGPEHHLAWSDEIEAPLDSGVQGFRFKAAGVAASIERDVAESAVTLAPEEVAALGAGPVSIEVRQIGGLALSRPATATIYV